MAYFRSNVSGGIPAGVRTLPTVDTASGSIATFDTDLTENLVDVKCQIVAKQASGTPSPVNPLPIGVYDSLTLYHNDINLWDEEWELGKINSTTGENEPSTTAYRSKNYIPVKPNMQIYIVKPLVNLGLRFYDINKNFISSLVVYVNYNITIPADCYYVRFHNTATPTYANDISFNYPNTDTTYHAFNGAYIPFNQTVANGVLDINSGKLRVTSVDRLFTGDVSTGWQYQTAYGTSLRFNYNNSDIKPNSTNIKSNMFEYKAVAPDVEGISTHSLSHMIILEISASRLGGSTVADLMTFFANNNLQVVYELDTPQEIQLDSTQITALLNENNIWCDTGDTEVKFLLTVGKKIS